MAYRSTNLTESLVVFLFCDMLDRVYVVVTLFLEEISITEKIVRAKGVCLRWKILITLLITIRNKNIDYSEDANGKNNQLRN